MILGLMDWVGVVILLLVLLLTPLCTVSLCDQFLSINGWKNRKVKFSGSPILTIFLDLQHGRGLVILLLLLPLTTFISGKSVWSGLEGMGVWG